MKVRNKSDLKIAYEILSCIKERTSEGTKPTRAEERIVELKREIRGFYKKADNRKIVKDNGIDGFVELVELPDFLESIEEATEYFEEYEVREAIPSMYDCTGQAFTSWYKIFERRGRLFAYHSICFDV